MKCEVCGGDLVPRDSGISLNISPCTCALQFLQSESNRRLHKHWFELKDAVSQLDCSSGENNKEHDIDYHVMVKNQRPGGTLSSAPRRNLSKIPLASSSAKSSRSQFSQHRQMNTNAIFDRMSRPHSALADTKSPTDILNLQEIRDEIVSLRQKFDEDLQDVRNAITGNMTEMAQLLNKPGVISKSKIEGKENAVPESSILSSAHRAFLDAMRHRRAFETNVAYFERSQAQKDAFNILGHLNDDNADVIRMRALLDDAVNNIGSNPKFPQQRPKQASARFNRLSAPKQQFKPIPVKRPAKPTVAQRPTSSPPKTTSITDAPRSAGLADLVTFSPSEPTTAPPLMRRHRVVLKSPSPKVREKVVRFDRTQRRSKSPTEPSKSKSKSSTPFVPLGMRQYTMWPPEKSQALTTTTSKEHRLEGDDRLSAEDIRFILEAALNQHLERQASQIRVQDRDAGTSHRDFTKERALSPIQIPKKPTLVDASSSPHIKRIIPHGESVLSIQRRKSSSLPSISSEFKPISERSRPGHSEEEVVKREIRNFVQNEISEDKRIHLGENPPDQVFVKEIPTNLSSRQITTESSNWKIKSSSLVQIQNNKTRQLELIPSETFTATSLENSYECLIVDQTEWDKVECVEQIPLSLKNSLESSPALAEAIEPKQQAFPDNCFSSSIRLSVSSLPPVLPQSPIFSQSEEAPSSVKGKEFESVQTVSGFSQTDLRSFSDGVWLDPDRSEGEYGGIPLRGTEQATAISKNLGPFPSLRESVSQSGEEEKIPSEGEFTLDQVANQSGGWVAPWRDPLLQLIAIGTAGETSKLSWNQQQEVKKVVALLDDRKEDREVVLSEPDETESSSADDLSWVKRIAAARRARKQAETPTPQSADKSDGEVSVPTSVKEFRRAVLARSSQRMRQRETFASDDDNEDDTLRETENSMEHKMFDVHSANKSQSNENGVCIQTTTLDAVTIPPKESC